MTDRPFVLGSRAKPGPPGAIEFVAGRFAAEPGWLPPPPDWVTGSLMAVLLPVPQDVDFSMFTANDFSHAIGADATQSLDCLLDVVLPMLQANNNRTFFARHPFAAAADAWLKSTKVKTVAADGMVLGVMESGQSSRQGLAELIRRFTDPWTGVAVVVEQSPAGVPPGHPDFHGRIEAVVVGAFDGEGYVLWASDGTAL